MWGAHSEEKTGMFLMAFASRVILASESHGARDHISLSRIRKSPNLEILVYESVGKVI
jgi:hypothetical protein